MKHNLLKNMLVAFLLVLLVASTAAARMVSVANDIVNMRTGPGKKNAILWELGKGYPLKVLSTKGNWIKVVDFENDTGWIYKKLVNRKPHLVVKNKIVNVRSGPGTKFKIVRQAKRGVVFTTLKRQAGWVKVRHEESRLVGWIMRSLLWGW